MIQIENADRLTRAKSELVSAQENVAAIEDRLLSLRGERSAALSEFERLSEMEQQDHLTRVLDGDAAAPVKPKRQSRITNLREQIAGIDLAIPALQARLDRANAVALEREHDLHRTILPILASWKSDALNDCAGPFRELLGALARLAAIDTVQNELVKPGSGVRLSQCEGIQNLFSGRALLQKFKANLPPRFASLAGDQWSSLDDLIEDRANALSKEIGV